MAVLRRAHPRERVSFGVRTAKTLVPEDFITKDASNNLEFEDATYNSVSSPQIYASASNCSISQNGIVSLLVSGSVKDDTSDLINSPTAQVQAVTVSAPNLADQTFSLSNTAQPVPPWRPYAFGALFSDSISFSVAGPGEYPITITTSENVAGNAATTEQNVEVTELVQNLVLSGTFQPTAINSIIYYTGTDTTPPAGGALIETGSGTNVFTQAQAPGSFSIAFLGSFTLTPQVDTLNAQLTWKNAAGLSSTSNCTFTETGPITNKFVCAGLQASCSEQFPQTREGDFQPTIIRFPDLTFLSDHAIQINTFGNNWNLKRLARIFHPM